MIMAEPKTAAFAGEVLKFATAPFRAGRQLDGAIDDLVQQMELKADQPRPDDPQTLTAKTAVQIEQMKQERNKEADQAANKLKMAELEQKDNHKKLELMNQRAIEQMKLNAKQGDAEGKLQVQNAKAMENREAHQAHMIEKSQDMEIKQQIAQTKLQDIAARSQERQSQAAERHAAQQFRLTQPPQPRRGP